MIGRLRGKIEQIDNESVIMDVAGVGYQVFCDARTLSHLASQQDPVTLIIETHVREDHIHLFGFEDVIARDWFRTLTTVQGVGVKMAMAILGLFMPSQLLTIIAAKDTKSLTKVSGVGAKLAERITTELKNKVTKMPTSSFPAQGVTAANALTGISHSISEDALSALVNLGYARLDAYNAVQQAMQGMEEANPALDSIIKTSLRLLMKI